MKCDDIQDTIEQSVDLAVANGYEMNKFFTLVSRGGRYELDDPRNMTCHPLETLVVGQYINDALNVEVSHILGVSLHWIEGFVDGYNDESWGAEYDALDADDPHLEQYMDGRAAGIKCLRYVKMIENEVWPVT